MNLPATLKCFLAMADGIGSKLLKSCEREGVESREIIIVDNDIIVTCVPSSHHLGL